MAAYRDTSRGIEGRSLQSRFVRSLLDILVLKLLDGEPLHGYAINAAFRRTFRRSFSPGTLYPLLYTLEEEGCLESEWRGQKRKRKVYRITQKGKKRLSSAYSTLNMLLRILGRGREE